MSVGHRRKGSNEDWTWNDSELKGAEEELRHGAHFDYDHDVPYTAGYSQDGFTIYIDKEVPQFLKVRALESRTKQVEIDLWKTIGFHETTEKSLEDEPYNLDYQKAHQCALRLERAYVEALGADWDDYNLKTIELVDKIYKRAKFDNVPDNLDLTPYLAEEDDDCLKKMGKE